MTDTTEKITHTWKVTDEGGEVVTVTLTCDRDEIIEVPLKVQYLIDLLANASEEVDAVSDYLYH